MKIEDGEEPGFLPVVLTLESATELKVLRDALYDDDPEDEAESNVNADLFCLLEDKAKERGVPDDLPGSERGKDVVKFVLTYDEVRAVEALLFGKTWQFVRDNLVGDTYAGRGVLASLENIFGEGVRNSSNKFVR